MRCTEHDIDNLGTVEPELANVDPARCGYMWSFGALQLRADAIVGYREIDRGDRRPELYAFRLYTTVGSFVFATENQRWWKP